MTNVNLNLPEELQQFVNGQAQAGQFDGPAAYIQALIERAKNGKERLESLLLEGLDSGDPSPLDADEWSRILRDVEQRLSNGRKVKGHRFSGTASRNISGPSGTKHLRCVNGEPYGRLVFAPVTEFVTV